MCIRDRTRYVPVPLPISKRMPSPPALPAAFNPPVVPLNPVTDAPLATLIVRSLALFNAPVRIAGAPDAEMATPVATLTMIAVVSVPALYPAAVARVKIFTFDVFDVMSSVIELIAWPP